VTQPRTTSDIPASPRPATVTMRIVVDLPDPYETFGGVRGAPDEWVGEEATRESLAREALASMEAAREKTKRELDGRFPKKKRRTKSEMAEFRAGLKAQREARREAAVPQWLLDADKAEEADVQAILNGEHTT
jgi:hypothetical protein